jgi:peptidoglycan/LPS O-acetylase OafA/YrhL
MSESKSHSSDRESGSPVPEIERLRGLAIIAVVGIHASWLYASAAGFDQPAGRAVLVLHVLCGFGVPLFFALSAVGLSLNHRDPMSLAAYVAFLRRRAARLLPAYVVWSLVSFALMQPEAMRSPLRVLRMLLLGAADWQFYYVPLVFQLYVLWPLLMPLARWAARSPAAAVGIAAAGATVSYGWWRLTGSGWIPPGFPFTLPLWLLYAALGIAAAPYLSTLRTARRRPGTILAPTVAAATAGLFVLRTVKQTITANPSPRSAMLATLIFQVPQTVYIYAALAVSALAVARSRSRVSRLLETLGTLSYGVYLTHLLVLRALMYGLTAAGLVGRHAATVDLAAASALWIATLAASAALVWLLSRSPRLRPMVSNR